MVMVYSLDSNQYSNTVSPISKFGLEDPFALTDHDSSRVDMARAARVTLSRPCRGVELDTQLAA